MNSNAAWCWLRRDASNFLANGRKAFAAASSLSRLKTSARVHLHAYASETIATVNLLEGKQLKPGAEAFAQLRLSAPLLLIPGDRFIVRQFSPVITIGGGAVLDAFPIPKLKDKGA